MGPLDHCTPKVNLISHETFCNKSSLVCVFLSVQVDVKDPRFQAMFTSHLFNLDPSHPSYKKTKATQSILTEKQRRREEEQRRVEDTFSAQQVSPSQGEAAASKPEVAGKKRENDSDTQTAETTSKKSMDPSLSLLVKSIKSKTEQFQARKKQKFM